MKEGGRSQRLEKTSPRDFRGETNIFLRFLQHFGGCCWGILLECWPSEEVSCEITSLGSNLTIVGPGLGWALRKRGWPNWPTWMTVDVLGENEETREGEFQTKQKTETRCKPAAGLLDSPRLSGSPGHSRSRPNPQHGGVRFLF